MYSPNGLCVCMREIYMENFYCVRATNWWKNEEWSEMLRINDFHIECVRIAHRNECWSKHTVAFRLNRTKRTNERTQTTNTNTDFRETSLPSASVYVYWKHILGNSVDCFSIICSRVIHRVSIHMKSELILSLDTNIQTDKRNTHERTQLRLSIAYTLQNWL